MIIITQIKNKLLSKGTEQKNDYFYSETKQYKQMRKPIYVLFISISLLSGCNKRQSVSDSLLNEEY